MGGRPDASHLRVNQNDIDQNTGDHAESLQSIAINIRVLGFPMNSPALWTRSLRWLRTLARKEASGLKSAPEPASRNAGSATSTRGGPRTSSSQTPESFDYQQQGDAPMHAAEPTMITNKLSVWWVAILHSGSLATGDNRSIRLWKLPSGTFLRSFEVNNYQMESCAASRDGNLLAGSFWDSHGQKDRRTIVWSLETGREVFSTNASYRKMGISASGTLLAAAINEEIAFWDIKSRKMLFTLNSGFVLGLAFSHDDRILVTGTDEPEVRVWNLEQQTLSTKLRAGNKSISRVACSLDGTTIAGGAAGRDSPCSVFLWDARTGSLRQTLEGHRATVTDIAFSPDGKMLATTSIDNTIRFWNSETGKLMHTLEGHGKYVRAVSFSQSGDLLAAGGDTTDFAGEVETWRVADILRRNIEPKQEKLAAESSPNRDIVIYGPNGEPLIAVPKPSATQLATPAPNPSIRPPVATGGFLANRTSPPHDRRKEFGTCFEDLKRWRGLTVNLRAAVFVSAEAARRGYGELSSRARECVSGRGVAVVYGVLAPDFNVAGIIYPVWDRPANLRWFAGTTVDGLTEDPILTLDDQNPERFGQPTSPLAVYDFVLVEPS